ncbi:type II secretion system protein [Photobacterium leiognathi]|uniref:type II secretion system protein n=1 Tax=Photobacterium leiognathi TaxID=553611 RepID=UPI002981DE5C|nr:type II secretion system protein [Photobacterium leiognathi]
MKKNGFTLIELVVVIVILGILAVVAAPKFMNLQVDARNASLKGLEGSLKSALGVGYSKLAMNGLENSPYVTTRDKGDKEPDNYTFSANVGIPGCSKDAACTFYYGYPEATEETFKRLLANMDSDWEMVRKKDNLLFTFRQFTKKVTQPGKPDITNTVMTRDNCFITYTPPTSESSGYKLTFTPCK